jgi:hypothetical protein
VEGEGEGEVNLRSDCWDAQGGSDPVLAAPWLWG